MSSTDDKSAQAMAALFDEVIAPMVRSARAGSTSPFPLKPDPSLASYYLTRPNPAMTREDFVAPSCMNFEELEERLAAHWRALGRDDLVAAVPRFVAAARASYATGKEQDGEVSPFVYVMY